jgi:hypothetical protein
MKPGDLVSVHLPRRKECVRVPCSADGWETHEYLDLKVGDKGIVVKIVVKNQYVTQYEVLFHGRVCLMWESQVRAVE